MSKKFIINDYPGKYVMHCKTEEEAKDFCRVLHEAGRKWNNGKSYIDDAHYNNHDKHTCYYFNEGKFADRDYVKIDDEGPYTILEWSDFMGKEFTRDDLKNGDVVLRRGGDVEIFIYNRFIDNKGGWSGWGMITDDLTSINGLEARSTIMAVRRPNDISDMTCAAFEKNLGRLVYEREETVEMTLEEVCKALGKNVKIVKEK